MKNMKGEEQNALMICLILKNSSLNLKNSKYPYYKINYMSNHQTFGKVGWFLSGLINLHFNH